MFDHTALTILLSVGINFADPLKAHEGAKNTCFDYLVGVPMKPISEVKR